MKVCIKGAAEEVKVGDIGDVCLDVDRILLATDGSEPSVLATQYAVTLAKTFDAEVKAIYVDTGAEALEYPEERMSDEVVDNLHPSVRGLGISQLMCERNGITCQAEIVKGGVAKRIVHTAEEYDADLIVVGDTGRTGLQRLSLGSVAETVVKASPIPVLVIKVQ